MFTRMICNRLNTAEDDSPPIVNNFQVYRAVNFCLHQHWMLDDGRWTLDAVQCANKNVNICLRHTQQEQQQEQRQKSDRYSTAVLKTPLSCLFFGR